MRRERKEKYIGVVSRSRKLGLKRCFGQKIPRRPRLSAESIGGDRAQLTSVINARSLTCKPFWYIDLILVNTRCTRSLFLWINDAAQKCVISDVATITITGWFITRRRSTPLSTTLRSNFRPTWIFSGYTFIPLLFLIFFFSLSIDIKSTSLPITSSEPSLNFRPGHGLTFQRDRKWRLLYTRY